MPRIPFSLLAASAAALVIVSLPARAQEQPAAVEVNARDLAIGVCSVCHGPDGNSINPMYPRLAGQHAWYLEQQLKQFRDESRGDPYAVAYMWGMASGLSDETIDALAKYFSSQKMGPGKSHAPAVIDRGRQIYEHGIPTQGVPACAICHGADALGNKTFPRLAGQHAEYILKQLSSFQNNMRKVAVMHGVAANLHESEMKDVADYLESLP
jgi:cytochrome c553